jgi:hypothetical protein
LNRLAPPPHFDARAHPLSRRHETLLPQLGHRMPDRLAAYLVNGGKPDLTRQQRPDRKPAALDAVDELAGKLEIKRVAVSSLARAVWRGAFLLAGVFAWTRGLLVGTASGRFRTHVQPYATTLRCSPSLLSRQSEAAKERQFAQVVNGNCTVVGLHASGAWRWLCSAAGDRPACSPNEHV